MLPVACYLDVEAIIELAKEQKVDAIHPGYYSICSRASIQTVPFSSVQKSSWVV